MPQECPDIDAQKNKAVAPAQARIIIFASMRYDRDKSSILRMLSVLPVSAGARMRQVRYLAKKADPVSWRRIVKGQQDRHLA